MKKKYDIKTTDVETLKKWYHLMTCLLYTSDAADD